MATGNGQFSGSIPIDAHDLEMVTAGTTPRDLARGAICAVDELMRDHYFKSRTRLMANLKPVIIVQYSFGGGTYTLINEGFRETVSPVGPNFELCKSIAHIPLGIYSMLAPYLNGARPVGWQDGILNFRKVITNAFVHLEAAELPPAAVLSCRTIIGASAEFLDGAIGTQRSRSTASSGTPARSRTRSRPTCSSRSRPSSTACCPCCAAGAPSSGRRSGSSSTRW